MPFLVSTLAAGDGIKSDLKTYVPFLSIYDLRTKTLEINSAGFYIHSDQNSVEFHYHFFFFFNDICHET